MSTLYLSLSSVCTGRSSESQARYWLSAQIKDSDWLLVCGVKNGVIGIFLMGEYSWEIRECRGKTRPGPFQNTWTLSSSSRTSYHPALAHPLNLQLCVENQGELWDVNKNTSEHYNRPLFALLLSLFTEHMGVDTN